jgi:hypothetical protein
MVEDLQCLHTPASAAAASAAVYSSIKDHDEIENQLPLSSPRLNHGEEGARRGSHLADG